MTDEQKNKHRNSRRPVFWGSAGGLKVISRGKAAKAFKDIHEKWSSIAAKRAREARKAAGWQGWDSRTSPTGATTGPNGQRFGPYTLPTDEFDKGMWNGILTDNMRFTL